MNRQLAPILILVLALLTACNAATPTSLPSPTPTSPPVDDLAPYKPALIPANQNDLAELDRPTRYSLTLKYDPEVPSLSGSEAVQYTNRGSAPLSEIYFRLFANYPATTTVTAIPSSDRISVSHLAVDGNPVASSLAVQDTALRVGLDSPLAPNASANLQLDFAVTVPRNGQQHYADFTATDAVTTMPTVYPLIPADDASGWHIELPPAYGDLVYADASLYAITMTVPTTMTVIASGSTVGTTDNHDGTTTWHIVGGPMRDFDLNVTSVLQKASSVGGDTTINSWYEPADADSGKSALDYATKAFKDYEGRFGTYPYRELDIVESPTTAGGIEYPGAISISRVFYHDTRQRQVFEFDVAHEVSHQWWYGVVGDDQVNLPWVDESLAQYSSLIYEEDTYGKTTANQILRDYFEGEYDRARQDGQDAPVNLPVAAYTESEYSAIVYGKGPLFYDAIRKKMGDPAFFKFLQTYFEHYHYKIATGDDILKTAQQVCACDLRNEYKEWILSPQK